MDEGFAEEECGPGRGNDLVYERPILVGCCDNVLGRDIDFVAASDYDGSAVVRPEVGEIGKCFDEVAVEESVLCVCTEGDVCTSMEPIFRWNAEVFFRISAVDVGVHFNNAGFSANEFFGHGDHGWVGGVGGDGRVRFHNVGHKAVMGLVG